MALHDLSDMIYGGVKVGIGSDQDSWVQPNVKADKAKKTSFLVLKRFGICVLTALLLVIYVSAATYFRIRFYLPIGIIIFSLYSWIIVNRFTKIYPLPGRPIGNLLITFSITGFSQYMQSIKYAKLIEAGQLDYIYSAAETNAYANVANLMMWILLIYYFIVKYNDKRRRKTIPISK